MIHFKSVTYYNGLQTSRKNQLTSDKATITDTTVKVVFLLLRLDDKKLFNKQKQKPVSKVHLHGTTTPRSHFTTRPIRANSTQSKCYEFWVRHFSVNAAQMHTVARCVLCYLRIARLHRNDREKTNDKFVHA